MNSSFRPLMTEMYRITASGHEVKASETLLWDALVDDSSPEYDRVVAPDLIVGRSKLDEFPVPGGKMLLRAETYNESSGLTPLESMYMRENSAVLLGYLSVRGELIVETDDNQTVLAASFLLYTDTTVEELTEFDESSLVKSDKHGFRNSLSDFLDSMGFSKSTVNGIRTPYSNSDWLGFENEGFLNDVEIGNLALGLHGKWVTG